MSKLGELRREEEIAQLELEKAEKEAQRIKMSVQDLMDEQSSERDEQLKKITLLAEVEVEKKIIELSEKLTVETKEKLSQLEEKKEVLEKAATESLKEYILRSGSQGR